MPDHPFREGKILPDIQSKAPLLQLGVAAWCPVSCLVRKEMDASPSSCQVPVESDEASPESPLFQTA